MSASSMKKKGLQTEAKVLKALGKRPKSAAEVATKVVISRKKVRGKWKATTLSASMARIALKKLNREGRIDTFKQGRTHVYAVKPFNAPVSNPDISGDLSAVAP